MDEQAHNSAFPARIHVLLARSAPLGVIIRRGPSKQVATILWNRADDTFALGQWLKGRIYERRSDLSPDGRYLIYFAMNGKWNTESRGAWTAISRAPYLKALAMFPKGDCWNGGGLWTEPNTYWLNEGYGHTVLQDTHECQRDGHADPEGGRGGECLSVYYPHLLRSGWRITTRDVTSDRGEYDVLEKSFGNGWVLRKLAFRGINSPEGKGCYWDEHVLEHWQSGTETAYPDWEWADRDGERIVWASRGALYAATLSEDGLADEKRLADFNGMTFEAVEAPY